jgi:hypothetical protein
VFQVILIHFLLIFTESETFQQTSQTILQSYSDLSLNHFSVETKTFLFLSESGVGVDLQQTWSKGPSPSPHALIGGNFLN